MVKHCAEVTAQELAESGSPGGMTAGQEPGPTGSGLGETRVHQTHDCEVERSAVGVRQQTPGP